MWLTSPSSRMARSILREGSRLRTFRVLKTYIPGLPFIEWSATFKASVPEPSSIVPMATGAVVVATWVVIRRRCASKALARAFS